MHATALTDINMVLQMSVEPPSLSSVNAGVTGLSHVELQTPS